MLTVVEANTKKDLTRLSHVKAELGVTDRDSDTLIKRYITQASDIVARYCNRVFAIETVTEAFRVRSGARSLALSRYPVIEIVSILDGDDVLTADDYEIDLESGIIERLARNCSTVWPVGKSSITYRAGFTLPDGLPNGIERATILLVKQLIYAGDRDPMVRSEVVDGAGSTDYFSGNSTGLSSEVQGLLEPHVKPNG